MLLEILSPLQLGTEMRPESCGPDLRPQPHALRRMPRERKQEEWGGGPCGGRVAFPRPSQCSPDTSRGSPGSRLRPHGFPGLLVLSPATGLDVNLPLGDLYPLLQTISSLTGNKVLPDKCTFRVAYLGDELALHILEEKWNLLFIKKTPVPPG